MIDLQSLRDVVSYETTHTLPLETNREVFEERIAPELFGHLRPYPAGRRAAVFLIASQGAGKSAFARRHGRELFGHDDYSLVEGDQLQHFHPAYEALVKQAEDLPVGQRWTVFEALRPDVKRWARQAQHYLWARGICMLKSAVTDDRRMRKARDHGYWVWAVFLGVPVPISLQGVVYRFQNSLDLDGFGRLTQPDVLKEGLAGPPKMAELIESGGLADRVSLYRRDGFPSPEFDHDTVRDGRIPAGVLREAVAHSRLRPFNAVESEEFTDRQNWLWSRVDSSLHPWLEKIDTMATPLLPTATA